MSSVFEFEKVSIIEKINFLCKKNNVTCFFGNIVSIIWITKLYREGGGDHTLPLGAMEIVRSTFFKKTITDEMKKSISVEQRNAFL